jgi:hypothetical protein
LLVGLYFSGLFYYPPRGEAGYFQAEYTFLPTR